jgi:hypothetical protein
LGEWNDIVVTLNIVPKQNKLFDKWRHMSMNTYNYSNFFNGKTYIFVFGVIVSVWLLARELRNWYWKHNDMISLMEEISEKLTIIDNSINKQNNNDTQIEPSPPENFCINEGVIKEELTEKKPKESIWTRKLF